MSPCDALVPRTHFEKHRCGTALDEKMQLSVFSPTDIFNKAPPTPPGEKLKKREEKLFEQTF